MSKSGFSTKKNKLLLYDKLTKRFKMVTISMFLMDAKLYYKKKKCVWH